MNRTVYLNIFFFTLTASFVFGQKIDTIKYYAFRSMHIDYVKNKYVINGFKVSSKRGEEVDSCNCILERRCGDSTKHIFFVKTFDLHEKLLYSAYQNNPEHIFWGPYKEYYPNGKIKIEGEYLFFGTDLKMYQDKKNWNKKIGLWKYYNKKGKLKRSEKQGKWKYYNEAGTLIKEELYDN